MDVPRPADASIPEVARPVLEYRYKTMPGAREQRRAAGLPGAVLPVERRRRPATCGRSATAGIRRTASPRSTCRATSHWPSGSTTWRPGTPPGCASAGGRCCGGSPSSGPAASPRTPTAATRSTTSPGPTSTATASTTRSSPTPSRPSPCATRRAPRRCSASRSPRSGRPSPTTCGCRSTRPSRSSCSTTVTRARMIKQADTVLLLYPLEWPMSNEVAANTLDYYAARTDPDGPAMTDAVHAIDAAHDRRAGLCHAHLPDAVDPAVRARSVRAVRRGPRREGGRRGSPRGLAGPALPHRLRRLRAGLHPSA